MTLLIFKISRSIYVATVEDAVVVTVTVELVPVIVVVVMNYYSVVVIVVTVVVIANIAVVVVVVFGSVVHTSVYHQPPPYQTLDQSQTLDRTLDLGFHSQNYLEILCVGRQRGWS